jgi:hypothetical protein
MRDEDEEEHDEVLRRVREDMHAATERLRARLDALRRMRRDVEPPAGNHGGSGGAPAR